MGSRGIVCGVWEEVKDGHGVVGMVPATGATGGNIKKWCFQLATLYTLNSSESGASPLRSPSVSMAESGKHAASPGTESIKIRLHLLLVAAAKWEDYGNCSLQIRRPPPGWRQALRANHGLEKRVTVTKVPKKESDSPKVVLDAVLGSGCFTAMGSRGIVCGVWEEVKDGHGVVGMVPATGATGGNIKKWCFQLATLYTLNSSESGASPLRSPSVSMAESGKHAASPGTESIKIRLHLLLVAAAKWEDYGNCSLQIRRPPPGWRQALRANHGLEKRVTVTKVPKKESDSPKVVLDAVLGSGCFTAMGSRGIVCGVWEEVKDGHGVVGMVPATGATGGNIKKWCFQLATAGEAGWVLRLLHQEVLRA
ncbi:SRm160/300 splicing coactivator [Ophiocordyceps sinensis CO18]|uniref:SRm160/300 splicing coactivator n=1 Tax=Ophiocordyceps sinensis (strain Co18 / CGMCC 3.14243) TaxID=911162 RepID=T5ADH7_OPHSC|nr:SRm160/300 splicing coactivator [Ophiocordyceps sinensis CO18]